MTVSRQFSSPWQLGDSGAVKETPQKTGAIVRRELIIRARQGIPLWESGFGVIMRSGFRRMKKY